MVDISKLGSGGNGKTYYAWSPIKHGDGTVKVGEQVSRSDLDMGEDDWNYLIETGAVRTREYPDIAHTTSPVEHYKEQVAAMNEGNFAPDNQDEAGV